MGNKTFYWDGLSVTVVFLTLVSFQLQKRAACLKYNQVTVVRHKRNPEENNSTSKQISIKSLELHYTMIQFLIIQYISPELVVVLPVETVLAVVSATLPLEFPGGRKTFENINTAGSTCTMLLNTPAT